MITNKRSFFYNEHVWKLQQRYENDEWTDELNVVTHKL